MAIKVKLEKDGFIKDGLVGYSWTSLFFNVWVPAFRLDFNGFIIFFIIMFINKLMGNAVNGYFRKLLWIFESNI